MKLPIQAIALALGSVLAFSQRGKAANCTPIEAFIPLRKSVEAFAERSPRDGPAFAQIASSITEKIELLRAALSYKGEIVSDYCLNLQAQAEILEGGAHLPAIDQATTSGVAVLQDLALKVSFADATLAFVAPPSLVSVTVFTERQGTPVNDLMIFMNPLFYNQQSPLYSFPLPSSPSERALPPGRYTLQARDSANVVCTRPVEVGLDGKLNLSVVCVLP